MSKRRIAVENLTIRKKLFLVFGVLIAIFMANGIYTGYSLNSINDGALRIHCDAASPGCAGGC